MRPVVLPAVLGLVMMLPGCGLLRSLGNPGVDGFGREDESLRRTLATGGYEQALQRLAREKEAAPRDELLRLMYEGTVARYAGRYEESSRALEQAALISEDRVTKSISRAALSTVTSDLALAYSPVDAERLLIHYYGALNYLDRGMLDDAAVEVRRLSHTLAVLEDRGEGRTGLVASPFLRYFAGSVFDAAGYPEEAEVSYRQAAALARDANLARYEPLPDTLGEVVLVVETGFVAHAVEQSLNVMLGGDEVGAYRKGDADDRIAIAAGIAGRIVAHALEQPSRFGYGDRPRSLFIDAPQRSLAEVRKCSAPRTETRGTIAVRAPQVSQTPAAGETVSPLPATNGAPVAPALSAGTADSAEAKPVPIDTLKKPEPKPIRGSTRAASSVCAKDSDKDGADDDEDDANPYLMRIAWPVFLMPSSARLTVQPLEDSLRGTPLRLSADVSRAVIDDYDARRTILLARTVARAAAKMALTTGVENSFSEKHEDLGKVLGFLTNAGTALLEHADTRSWHLLPSNVSLIRVRLPAGQHTIPLRVGSGERIVKTPVTVLPGRVTVTSTRIWQ